MPWQLPLSLVNININSLGVQGNPLLSVNGNGGTHIYQANSSDQFEPYPVRLRAPGHGTDSHPLRLYGHALDRRVEVQPRVRRKLDEARGYPNSIYGIDNIAQVATDILAVIERNPGSFCDSHVDLAMNAHAVAYIALISCFYGFEENGRRRVARASVRKLLRFLSKLHELLVHETAQRGVLVRMERVFSKWRRNNQVQRMQEELLDILRDIEKDEDANILTSLSLALECPYQ